MGGLKAGARYRLKQNRINFSVASVLGKDNTGWKNVLGATGTYTIKPERNSGEAAPITLTGTLMHTKGKNALGGDVPLAAALPMAVTSVLNLLGIGGQED